MSELIILSQAEFTAMESLLARLLGNAESASEEANILGLHSRLEAIYRRSSDLRASRERLTKINKLSESESP